jgi:hypothetical protein
MASLANRSLEGLAALYALRGEPREAALLLAMADEIRQEVGLPGPSEGAELLWRKLETERALNLADLDSQAEPDAPTRIGLDGILAHALDRLKNLEVRDPTP